MSGSPNPPSRRQAFALAAALALTAITGGAAVTGLRHSAPAHRQAPAVQLVQPASPAPAPPQEESD